MAKSTENAIRCNTAQPIKLIRLFAISHITTFNQVREGGARTRNKEGSKVGYLRGQRSQWHYTRISCGGGEKQIWPKGQTVPISQKLNTNQYHKLSDPREQRRKEPEPNEYPCSGGKQEGERPMSSLPPSTVSCINTALLDNMQTP